MHLTDLNFDDEAKAFFVGKTIADIDVLEFYTLFKFTDGTAMKIWGPSDGASIEYGMEDDVDIN